MSEERSGVGALTSGRGAGARAGGGACGQGRSHRRAALVSREGVAVVAVAMRRKNRPWSKKRPWRNGCGRLHPCPCITRAGARARDRVEIRSRLGRDWVEIGSTLGRCKVRVGCKGEP
eukprot:scaffold36186_cov51-Isochrysis_galbana.AAC.1